MGNEIRILLEEPTDAIISLGALSALMKRHDGNDSLDLFVRQYEDLRGAVQEYNLQASEFLNDCRIFYMSIGGDFTNLINQGQEYSKRRDELSSQRMKMCKDLRWAHSCVVGGGHIPYENYEKYYREEFCKYLDASDKFEEYLRQEIGFLPIPKSGMLQVEKASMRSAIKKIDRYLKD